VGTVCESPPVFVIAWNFGEGMEDLSRES
jgi:hypothetical protein